jgi:hypothetical protein
VPEGDVERLTLAAHYDTLPSLDGFVGAVDSAASCAMLMRLAELLEPGLERMWRERRAVAGGDGDLDGLGAAKGLQLVFFDGEEAWEKWSDEDSLYGSRWVGGLDKRINAFYDGSTTSRRTG